jgi:ferrochelatase
MNTAKKGILLVNLGTPDSTKTSDVRKYLREFLSDPRVIDIGALPRWLLVNLIIAPFRAPKSAAEYRKLWTPRGSPLLYHSLDIQKKLQEKLGDSYVVELGMRYQNPPLADALQRLYKQEVSQIVVVPLFPQYASATTGSVIEKVMEIARKWPLIPKMVFIDEFISQPPVVQAWKAIIAEHLSKEEFDYVLFTYHGLPQRQLKKADPVCGTKDCCEQYNQRNRLCYRAQCIETTRLLAKELNLQEGRFSSSFQSRLGRDPWVQPYTEVVVKDLAKKGVKKLLALSPSFVADCLETTVEIGETYKELFEENGGEHFELVECLNSHPLWVEALEKMVL